MIKYDMQKSGDDNDGISIKNLAVYWKNGVEHILPGGPGGTAGGAYTIAV